MDTKYKLRQFNNNNNNDKTVFIQCNLNKTFLKALNSKIKSIEKTKLRVNYNTSNS